MTPTAVRSYLIVVLISASPRVCTAQNPTAGSVKELCQEANELVQKYLDGEKKEKKWVLLALRKALDARKLDKNSALPHVSMAKAFLAMGDREKARQRVVAALQLDESNEEARRIMEELGHQTQSRMSEAGGKSPDFSGGSVPGLQDDGSGCWSATENGYLFKGKQQDGLRYAHFGLPMQDFVVEMDVRKIAGDNKKSKWGYGLYVRSDGRQQDYYEFIIQSGSQFQIGKSIGGKFTKLASFDKSDALKTGHGVWNALKVTAMGNVLCFYANGQLLKKLSDDSIQRGKIGLFAVDAYDSNEPDTVEFRNVRVMKP